MLELCNVHECSMARPEDIEDDVEACSGKELRRVKRVKRAKTEPEPEPESADADAHPGPGSELLPGLGLGLGLQLSISKNYTGSSISHYDAEQEANDVSELVQESYTYFSLSENAQRIYVDIDPVKNANKPLPPGVFERRVCFEVPQYLTKRFWRRHDYSLTDIEDTMDMYPPRPIWQVAQSEGLGVATNATKVSYDNEDELICQAQATASNNIIESLERQGGWSTTSRLTYKNCPNKPCLPVHGVSAALWRAIVECWSARAPDDQVLKLQKWGEPRLYASLPHSFRWKNTCIVPVDVFEIDQDGNFDHFAHLNASATRTRSGSSHNSHNSVALAGMAGMGQCVAGNVHGEPKAEASTSGQRRPPSRTSRNGATGSRKGRSAGYEDGSSLNKNGKNSKNSKKKKKKKRLGRARKSAAGGAGTSIASSSSSAASAASKETRDCTLMQMMRVIPERVYAEHCQKPTCLVQQPKRFLVGGEMCCAMLESFYVTVTPTAASVAA